MSDKMKAALFKEPKKPLEVTEANKPKLERDDDVLIRVVACGLCHTDLSYIDFGVPTFRKASHYPWPGTGWDSGRSRFKGNECKGRE